MQGRVKIALGLGTALLAAGALTGCNPGGGTGGENGQAYSEAPPANAYKITPGQYETTIKVTNGSVEGFPPEMQQQLQQAVGQAQTQRACIPIGFSVESISLKNMRFDLPNNMGGCNFGDVSQASGTMRGALNCEIKNLPQGGPDAPRAVAVSATWNATYTDNSWTGTMHVEGSEPGGNRRGNIDVELSSRRVGDCPAGSNPFAPRPTPPSYPMSNSANSSTYPSPSYGGGNMVGSSSNMTTNTTTTTSNYSSNY